MVVEFEKGPKVKDRRVNSQARRLGGWKGTIVQIDDWFEFPSTRVSAAMVGGSKNRVEYAKVPPEHPGASVTGPHIPHVPDTLIYVQRKRG
jgi:hypothetical protein